MTSFVSRNLSLQEYWRAIILYGENVTSYKFALAKTLLEINPDEGQLIKLDELSPIFSKHLCTHLKDNSKQGTSPTSKYFDLCRKYNLDKDGGVTKEELYDATTKNAFGDVIERFHNVNGRAIDNPFYIDEVKLNKGIKVTSEFSKLKESEQFINLDFETEARWNLVETAWNLGISKNLLHVDIDDKLESLIVRNDRIKRVTVTSSRDALNGYQKGYCFYCKERMIDLSASFDNTDVDHFLPHKLKEYGFKNIDGVWNLVLSCPTCNRGTEGKFMKLPSLKFLKDLHERNEYLIGSKHPLRETLIRQTGGNISTRKDYLNNTWNEAKTILIHEWWPT